MGRNQITWETVHICLNIEMVTVGTVIIRFDQDIMPQVMLKAQHPILNPRLIDDRLDPGSSHGNTCDAAGRVYCKMKTRRNGPDGARGVTQGIAEGLIVEDVKRRRRPRGRIGPRRKGVRPICNVVIEDAVTSAQRRFTIAKDIPPESNSRRQAMRGVIHNVGLLPPSY